MLTAAWLLVRPLLARYWREAAIAVLAAALTTLIARDVRHWFADRDARAHLAGEVQALSAEATAAHRTAVAWRRKYEAASAKVDTVTVEVRGRAADWRAAVADSLGIPLDSLPLDSLRAYARRLVATGGRLDRSCTALADDCAEARRLAAERAAADSTEIARQSAIIGAFARDVFRVPSVSLLPNASATRSCVAPAAKAGAVGALLGTIGGVVLDRHLPH